MPEKEILHLLQSADPRSAEVLLRHYGPLMTYVISPILQNQQDREECLSEAVMRILQKISLYDPEKGSWTAWVTSVTRSVALNKVRANRKHPQTEELAENLASAQPTPEEEMLRRERQQELRCALEKLPAGDRLLFYRKYYYLQPTAQIARETGMSERAVEGRLYRIKRRLRKELGGDGHG